MRLSVLSVLVYAALVLGVAGMRAAPAAKADKSDKPAKKDDAKNKPINAKCPVQGDDIDPAVTTTYKGKTVAFCCKDCIKDFKKDPEKYMKQIAADNKKAEEEKKKGEKDNKKSEGKPEEKAAGKAAKPVNEFCVVHTDDAVDPAVTTKYEGKLIGFCCEDCQKKFDLDPKAYALKLK